MTSAPKAPSGATVLAQGRKARSPRLRRRRGERSECLTAPLPLGKGRGVRGSEGLGNKAPHPNPLPEGEGREARRVGLVTYRG